MNQRGFTLIEMLVAVTILAIGLLALASLQVTAMRTNTHAASLTEATALAQAAVERIQAMEGDLPWFKVSQEISDPADLENIDLIDIVAGTNYILTVDTEVDSNDVENITRIHVTVESSTAVQKVQGVGKHSVSLTLLKRYY